VIRSQPGGHLGDGHYSTQSCSRGHCVRGAPFLRVSSLRGKVIPCEDLHSAEMCKIGGATGGTLLQILHSRGGGRWSTVGNISIWVERLCSLRVIIFGVRMCTKGQFSASL
jgi:hypothetical protein